MPTRISAPRRYAVALRFAARELAIAALEERDREPDGLQHLAELYMVLASEMEAQAAQA